MQRHWVDRWSERLSSVGCSRRSRSTGARYLLVRFVRLVGSALAAFALVACSGSGTSGTPSVSSSAAAAAMLRPGQWPGSHWKASPAIPKRGVRSACQPGLPHVTASYSEILTRGQMSAQEVLTWFSSPAQAASYYQRLASAERAGQALCWPAAFPPRGTPHGRADVTFLSIPRSVEGASVLGWRFKGSPSSFADFNTGVVVGHLIVWGATPGMGGNVLRQLLGPAVSRARTA